MPMNDHDARALTYLARRLRTETHGACEWDEAGVFSVVSGLIGQQLATSVERITRHAADPEAKTPGAINRPFVPDAQGPQRPREPRKGQHCLRCGRHLDVCDRLPCDEDTKKPVTRPREGSPPTPEYLAKRAAIAKNTTPKGDAHE